MYDAVLNITNGDSSVEIMRQGGIAGHFLPWRDVLHEGPVPANMPLAQLSSARAEFIAGIGWADFSEVNLSFQQRDALLASFRDFSKVTLWFEHDLYDQLQLIQILDWFHGKELGSTKLTMICTDRYLGYQTPENINELLEFEKPVTPEQTDLAAKAWAAFRQDNPKDWFDLRQMNTAVLPFLDGAVLRVLQEYPDSRNGLSRTAKICMDIIRDNELHPGRLFRAYQEKEERMFMGDLSFWRILQEMLCSTAPLIELPDGKKVIEPGIYTDIVSLSSYGKKVLEEESNWLDDHRIDKWMGGVKLINENLWMWDSRAGSLLSAKHV